MFRSIRKKKNEIHMEEIRELLRCSRRGVLAVNGDNGYPYAMPINYLYDENANKIIFHGAKSGHKVDSIKACDKICFTVYGCETVKEEAWAPYLRSAIIFGRCSLIEDNETAVKLLKRFAMKYYPSEEMVNDEIKADGQSTQMFQIDIEHISGKEVQEI